MQQRERIVNKINDFIVPSYASLNICVHCVHCIVHNKSWFITKRNVKIQIKFIIVCRCFFLTEKIQAIKSIVLMSTSKWISYRSESMEPHKKISRYLFLFLILIFIYIYIFLPCLSLFPCWYGWWWWHVTCAHKHIPMLRLWHRQI